MKKKKKIKSPTRSTRPRGSRKHQDRTSRAKPQPPPEIAIIDRSGGTYRQHKAHLRHKRGYVYLAWREGKRVRTFYLGKAPRSCPTGHQDQADELTTSTAGRRRARKRQPATTPTRWLIPGSEESPERQGE